MAIPKLFWAEVALSAIVLVIATAFDLKKGQIPNVIVFPAMALAFALSVVGVCVKGFSWGYFSRYILTASVFFFGILRLMGMGDIKLIMTLSLCNSPLTIFAMLAVGAVLLVAVQAIKAPKETSDQIHYTLTTISAGALPKARNKKTIPFAPYLLMGYVAMQVAGGLLCLL